MRGITIGIDAVNLRNGGGITHLKEFLTHARPEEHGIERIIIFSGRYTLDQLPERKWIVKHHDRLMDMALPFRTGFQLFAMDKLLQRYGCDILFAPGGLYQGGFRPFVGMSQNMLLFEKTERDRHGLSWPWVRLNILRKLQSRCFRRAEGIIFISKYAKNYILGDLKDLNGKENRLIHHGVGKRFEKPPKPQVPLSGYSSESPFKLLYVSSIVCYKHQWNVVEAVARLRGEGYPISLQIIGAPLSTSSMVLLEKAIAKFDPTGQFAFYLGVSPFEEIEKAYHEADGFIYASTCENMPNIVIEAMSSGLPMVASHYGPMPEFLGDACLYFDPVSMEGIVAALKTYLDNPERRAELADRAHRYSQQYTWENCSLETLGFLSEVVAKSRVFLPIGLFCWA